MNAKRERPRVAIALMSFERPEWILEALESIDQQTLKPDEVVILDNRSSQKVFQSVQPWLERGVRWSVAATEINSIQNFKRAFQELDSDYIYVMHDDDRLSPEFLKRGVEFLEAHPENVAVGCRVSLMDEKGHFLRLGEMPPDAAFNDEKEFRFMNSVEAAAFFSAAYIPFPTWIYRGRVREEILRFKTPHKVGDVFTIVQLADLGVLSVLPERLLEYRVHSGQESSSFAPREALGLEWFLIKKLLFCPRYWRQLIQLSWKALKHLLRRG